jgi:hypothetical protein
MDTGKIFYTEGTEGAEFTEHGKKNALLRPGSCIH